MSVIEINKSVNEVIQLLNESEEAKKSKDEALAKEKSHAAAELMAQFRRNRVRRGRNHTPNPNLYTAVSEGKIT